MAEDNSRFLTCDVRINDQLIVDVNLSKDCCLANLVQGLCEDSRFRTTAIRFCKADEEKQEEIEGEKGKEWLMKSFCSLNRNIFRAYVAIQILPSWKWLEFKDFIANFEHKRDTLTIGEVMGTLCGGTVKPTFQIVPKSETEADDKEVKSFVQQLLKTKSLATLSAAGCPLSKGMLSLIGQEKYPCTITSEKREKFVEWLRHQSLTSESQDTSEKSLPGSTQPISLTKIAKSRVTFDPESELFNLESWFDVNHRPGKELIQEYTDILNKGRSKKRCKRMLTQESIAVWFKNKTAKAKKGHYFAETEENLRNQGDTHVAYLEKDKNNKENGANVKSAPMSVSMATLKAEKNDTDSVNTIMVDDDANNVVSVATAALGNSYGDARNEMEENSESVAVENGGAT